MFGVLILGGCNSVGASDEVAASLGELIAPEMVDFDDGLDYFKAKLEYFENVVEILTVEALKPNADDEVIRSESESLLEQIKAERDDYIQFHNDNFEHRCYEDGGVIVEEEHGAFWCDELDAAGKINSERRLDVLFYGFEPLIPQTMAIEYLLFESLEDFNKVINELESEISDFEIEIGTRLAYAEDNETETWDLIQQGNLFWGYWEDLVTDYIGMLQRIEAINIGAESITEWSRVQRRLSALRGRLNDKVAHTFVTS